jgi:serine/threonine protein kinase
VPLLGSSTIHRFVVVFHDCPFTLREALHPRRTSSGAPTAAHAPPLLCSTDSKVDGALQMALGIEFVHGQQHVHGRLSSASFYFDGSGTQLRLFLGNILHQQEQAQEQRTPHQPHHQLPQNIRWRPHESIGLTDGIIQPPATASDVFGFGVLLWELFAGAGLPHSHAFDTDDKLFTAIIAQRRVPTLASPLWSTDVAQADLLKDVFAACVQHNPRDRLSISKVTSRFLEAGSNDRWEQDRTQLDFVEQLGSGQFGDVQKMATRLFSTDQSLDFVAVKTLKTSAGSTGCSVGRLLKRNQRDETDSASQSGTIAGRVHQRSATLYDLRV